MEENVRLSLYRSGDATCRDAGRFVAVMSEVERFLSKIQFDFVTGCWLWLDTPNSDGYPRFWRSGGRMQKAHRVAWELFRGPIPPGYTLDHLLPPFGPCTSKLCVRPWGHLEPVPPGVNTARRHARERFLNGAIA